MTMEMSVKIFGGAPKVPLRELIVECDERNNNGIFTLHHLRGISIEKRFIETKANMDGVSLTPYKIVEPGWISFVTVTSRNGGKISLAFNDSNEPYIVSSSYVVIRVSDRKRLDSNYLFLMLQRGEFDRLARFNSWGSARETYSYDDLSRYEIPLPSIEVQREYVAAYKSLQQLAEQNEALAEPLQKACEAFISEVSSRYAEVELGNYIHEFNERNADRAINIVKSVSVSKEFKDTNAKVNKNELGGYKIVPPMYISYVQTTKNEKCFASAINKFGYPIVVTSVNRVITSNDFNVLDNEFLAMWFRTPEFSRWAIYNSWGSAREIFDYEDLKKSKIPLPPIEVQRSIVALYHCAEEARAIAREVREQLKKLAPAMVQRAANTPVEV